MQVPVTSRNVQNRANIPAWYLQDSFDHVINIAFNCKFEPMRQVDRIDAEQRDPHKFAADASVVRNPPNLNSFKGRNFISSLRFPTHATFCEWCSANWASFFVSLPPGVQLHARVRAYVHTCALSDSRKFFSRRKTRVVRFGFRRDTICNFAGHLRDRLRRLARSLLCFLFVCHSFILPFSLFFMHTFAKIRSYRYFWWLT